MVQRGFLLAEDEAIKAKLANVVLHTDRRGDVTVPVRFRYPDADYNPGTSPAAPQGITYPLITIDQLAVVYDPERDHVNNVAIDYIPSTNVLEDDGLTEFPLPMRIYYSITTWAESWQDNWAIFGQLLHPNRFPMKHGWLYVPADDTIRQMFMVSVVPGNIIDAQRRRIFRRTYTVYVEAELLKTELAAASAEITELILDPQSSDDPTMVGI